MRYYSSTASEKTLSSAVSNTATSITLSDLTGLPASYPYTLVLDPDTTSEEIVTVTALSSGTTLTVVRGTDFVGSTTVTGGNGTAKQEHAAGATVKHMITARDLQEPQDHINATAGVHGVTGDVVGTSDTQTLTNKTISSSSNSISISAASVSGLTTLLDAKANLASPTFTGTPTLPSGTIATTQAAGNNTTAVATTAFVKSAVDTGVAGVIPSQTGNSGKYLTTNGSSTSWATVTSGGSGTVTSITASSPLTGGTITTSGTIGLSTTAGWTTSGDIVGGTIGTTPGSNAITLSNGSVVFEGSTDNTYETFLTVTNPTADRTITLPNASGTVALSDNMAVTGTNSTSTITTSSTSYTDGISVSFVAPTSGTVVIHHHAFFNVTTSSGCAASIRMATSGGTAVSGVGTADERGYIASQKGAASGSGNAAMSGVVYVSGLTAGTTYNVYQQYKATDATGSTISKRELVVIPSF